MFACIDNLFNNGCDVNTIEFLLSKGASIYEIAANGDTCFSLGKDRNFNKILYRLRKWPVSMFIIVLEHIGLYNFLGNDSICDFFQYFGKEDLESDNEDDYPKDPDGNILDYESDS